MKIKYKGVLHNNLDDAPFVGAILIAPTCVNFCKGCHNAHLRNNEDFPIYEIDGDNLLDMIKDNLLDEGIILSGLEWTEQPEQMLFLIEGALERDMEVMLYTHMKEEEFFKAFPRLKGCAIWIKFGDFDEDKKTNDNIHCNIKLSTENQYIKFLGVDTL
ncbi:MAG: 4Fe-4S cluster-binding domain-containing protein [Halanaerobiales bacterium]